MACISNRATIAFTSCLCCSRCSKFRPLIQPFISEPFSAQRFVVVVVFVELLLCLHPLRPLELEKIYKTAPLPPAQSYARTKGSHDRSKCPEEWYDSPHLIT